VAYAHIKGEPLSFMTYASLALVIVLGARRCGPTILGSYWQNLRSRISPSAP
jgi:hypothetical protein